MKKAGIIGASGYTGLELIKILQKHPGVELLFANSRNYCGKKASYLDPEISGNLKFTNFDIDKINQLNPDLIFLATPEKTSKEIIPKLKSKVIDLSYDYRFSKDAVYGLPELFRDKIRKARIVANPGCYATASILALLPIQDYAIHAILDCKSGYSGAGREKKYVNEPAHYEDNIIPYSLTTHKHVPEIQQFIKITVSFTPHVIPTFRGIICTAHVLLVKKPHLKEGVKEKYEKFYNKEPFIDIIDKIPELHDVQNTNKCVLGGFEVDKNNRLVVISAIDNLMKGASGQAVQNMNIMLGFRETEGLK